MNTTRKTIKESWRELSNTLIIPKNDAEYEQTAALLDELLDEVGEDENHELASLVNYVGYLVDEYEKVHYPEVEKLGENLTPQDMLLFLLEQHGHSQKDIADIFGSQGNVSKVLSGKREMNLNHIKKLCTRYNVSSDLFI